MERKAARLRLIDGNPSKRPTVHDVPRSAPQRPRRPPGLSEGARRFWDYIVPLLDDAGTLTLLDRPALVMMAEFYAGWEEANAAESVGLLVRGRRGGEPVKNPASQVARDKATLALKLFDRFGLDPASRIRLALEAANTPDLLEDILGPSAGPLRDEA